MSRRGVRPALVAALLTVVAVPAARAQSLRWVPHTGHYGAVVGARHGLSLTCDSLCPAGDQNSTAFGISLGRHITRRVRLELAGSIGATADKRSTFLSVGVATYLVSGLHVRGAVAMTRLDLADSTSTSFAYQGGPGFLVGGGFDIPIGRTFAFTPFVNYVIGTAKTITVGAGSTTAGDFHSLNLGVSLTRLAGMFNCTTRAGRSVWVRPRNRVAALACIAEVESAIVGGRPAGIKL